MELGLTEVIKHVKEVKDQPIKLEELWFDLDFVLKRKERGKWTKQAQEVFNHLKTLNFRCTLLQV